MIGLSKQQRSPFVTRDGTDEYFYEFVGGMIEDGETSEAAARRETKEETGIVVDRIKLTHIEDLTLVSKGAAEYGDFYLCEIPEQIECHDSELDAEENIEEIEWFDLYEIDLEKTRIPLSTKYIIEKTRLYYSEQRESKDLSDIEHEI